MIKTKLTNRSLFYIKITKYFTVLLLALIAFTLLGNFKKASHISYHSDTAFLLELTDNTIKQGYPESQILRTTTDAHKLMGVPFDKYKQNNFQYSASLLAPSNQLFNALDHHAYYGIYALSALSKLFSAETILSYLHSFSFVMLLLLAYLFLRSQQVSVGATLLFCLLITLYPAWAHSAGGQFYMDRFYMPFVLMYLLGIHSICLNHNSVFKKPVFFGLVLLSGIFAASFTERAAIMVGCSSLAVLFINWPSISSYRVRCSLGVLGILFFLYVYVYLSFRYDPFYKGAYSEGGNFLSDNIHFFSNIFLDRFREMYFTFFAINIGMLGFFAFFAGIRVAIVAIVCLIPNILVSVGGAELTGWASHYHAMYTPILIFTALLGYRVLSNSYFWQKHKIYQSSIKILPILVFIFINPLTGNINSPTEENFIGKVRSHMSDNIIAKAYNFYFSSSLPQHPNHLYAARFDVAIPYNKKVTSIARFMPTLRKDRKLFLYPIGIDNADYAVLPLRPDHYGNLYYRGAISYFGNKEIDKYDRHLTKRLESMGYRTDQPLLIAGDVFVVERSDNSIPIYGTELITNSNFLKGSRGWNTNDVNKIFITDNKVELNVNDFISQSIVVNENNIYKFSIKARCDSEDTYLNMNIAWIDRNDKEILTDFLTRMCKKDMDNLIVNFIAPRQAHLATITIKGIEANKVKVSSVSFKKRIRN